MRSLVYVYAVLEAAVPISIGGIDNAPIRWVEGALAAAVSEVPADEFEEAPLNEHIRDMSWLGPRAVAHDQVNGQLWERADAMLPLSFGTVFRDDERVRDMLQARATDFRRRLERVRGKGEWVVALERMETAPETERLSALKTEIAAASAGRAHLLRRRLVELERDELQRLQAEAVEDFVRDAERVTDGVYVEPIPSQATDRPLVRATVLVRDGDAVGGLAARWRERGYAVSETGPTPPYRFAAT